ncbi:MAG: hypothetical protein WCC59_10755 [Terriglobales bacterium]
MHHRGRGRDGRHQHHDAGDGDQHGRAPDEVDAPHETPGYPDPDERHQEKHVGAGEFQSEEQRCAGGHRDRAPPEQHQQAGDSQVDSAERKQQRDGTDAGG